MHALLARDIVHVWEWGWDKHPIDRALFILSRAFPELAWAELAALSIGRRNALLLNVREQLCGPTLRCFVNCPQCSAALEFAVDVSDIRGPQELEPAQPDYQLAAEGFRLRFRLPDSRDLAAIAGLKSAAAARRLLIQRCVLQASQGELELVAQTLSETIVTALAEHMSTLDPHAVLLFRLLCESCGCEWPASLDIATFFWMETAALAKRLLREVDALARAYSWREDDILALSDVRRRLYLEMVFS